jgi:hypothetical protein
VIRSKGSGIPSISAGWLVAPACGNCIAAGEDHAVPGAAAGCGGRASSVGSMSRSTSCSAYS